MSDTLPNIPVLRRYLEWQGWRAEPLVVPGMDLFVFEDVEFGEVEIVLPAHGNMPDVVRRIEDAIKTLSDINQIDFDALSVSIARFDFDIISSKIAESPVWKESVSLKVASSFVRHSRELLAAAALYELEKSSVQSPAQQARVYADACRFSHTFRGSFGFRILSHLGPHDDPHLSHQDGPPPPARRIIQRVSTSLRAVSQAVAQKQGDDIKSLMHLGLGMDSDGYEALARLLEQSESDDVSFSLSFSPQWRLPGDETDLVDVRIATSGVGLIREVAREMRVKPPETSITMQGRIIRLVSEHAPEDLLHPEGREIGVKWLSDGFGEPVVRVRLSLEQYREARLAHDRGKEVRVTGAIEMSGSGAFRMIQVQAFEVV